MRGRDAARRMLGLDQRRAQPKEWDYPESAEELSRLTGLEWRPLDMQPRVTGGFNRTRAGEGYWTSDLYDVRPNELPLWHRAWATRQHGWLVIVGADEVPGEEWLVHPRWLSAPELDRESAQRTIHALWDTMGAAALVYETDQPLLPYLFWVVPGDNLLEQFNLVPRLPAGDHRAFFLRDLRFLVKVAQRLSEVMR